MTRGLDPLGRPGEWPWTKVSAAGDGPVRFIYFGEHQPVQWAMGLPIEDGDYQIDLIDPWEMSVTPLDKIPPPKNHPTRHGDVVRGLEPDAAFGVDLPGRPYLALRVRGR